VRSLLAERLPHDLRVGHAVGVAGTITAIAALDLGLYVYDRFRVHGHRVRPDAVAQQLDRLAALPLAERRAVPALDPERAPVIVAGAVILQEVMAHLGLDELEASEHDLLHGAALEAADLPERLEGDAPPGAYTCC
jgi:exopolyphosphatase/guanosine-5'-triphosphate,3'-diphosphate pyrophosphatase